MENQKQNVKSGMKFYQPISAEFLNELFGTHYKQWMKCSYKLTNKIIMWFPSLQGKENYGWKNFTINNGETIVEEYVGDRSVRPSNFDVRDD